MSHTARVSVRVLPPGEHAFNYLNHLTQVETHTTV